MKKFIFVALLSLVLMIVGCGRKEGAVTLQIMDQGIETQTLLPDIDMTIASYDIVGTGPLGNTFTLTDQIASSCTVSKLAFGEWTVGVYAKNTAGVVIGQGSAVVMVHVGQTVTVNVVVKPLIGTGSLNLTVNWTSSAIENPSIASELIPPFGATQLLDFTLGTGTATYLNHALLAGYYSLTVQLLDNGILTMGAVEVVRIVKGGTTTGEFNFFNINQPGGEIIVGITPEMDDPLEVTLSGQVDELATTGSMTVTASVPAEVGNVVYVWYINGESKATGSTYTVSGLEAGVYRLDVTAFTVDGQRAGSVSHLFTVNETLASPYWIKTYSGVSGCEEYGSITLAHDGGYAVSGATDSFSAPAYLFPTIWKTDADGNLEWARQFEVDGGGIFYSIATAGDGGFIAVGSAKQTSVRDAFIAKVDVNGQVEWEKIMSGSDMDLLYDVIALPDGGCLAAGYSYTGVSNFFSLILARFNAGGEMISGEVINDSGASIIPYEIHATSDGGFCVVGETNDIAMNRSGLILKLSANLNIEWFKKLPANLGNGLQYRSFAETPAGDFLVAGTMGVDGSDSEMDIVLTYVTLAGDLLWSKQYGSASSERVFQINRTADNRYVVQGFRPSTYESKGNTCIFVVDEGGNLLSERWIGGTGDDACLDSKITGNGDLVGVGSTTSYHAAYSDFWIFKADSSATIPNSPYSWMSSDLTSSDLSLTNQLSALSSVGSFHLATYNALVPVTVIDFTVRDVTL